MNTEVTEIAKIDITEVTTIMQGAGLMLSKNEKSAFLAENAGNALLDTIEAEGMSDDVDAALNVWQGKAKELLPIMTGRRSPITQIMTKMAKFFTELENKLDPKKPESVYAKIQVKRNEWAALKAKEAKDKQDKILLEQNIANEKVNLTAEINTQIKSIYNNKLFTFKKFVTDTYNKLTLENLEEIKTKISETKIVYPLEAWNQLEPTIFAKFMKSDDVTSLINEEREKLYDECSANFRENMEAHKLETLDFIPSRINELKAIAKSSAAEKKRLEADAETRRKAQEALALKNKKEQEEADAKKIEAQKKMQTAGNLFNSSAALQQVKENQSKVREGYKINVLDTDGYAAIFMFYFEKEGRGLTVEEFGKKTMVQMTTFAEKSAHKNNEKIDSKHIEYVETFKAVVTK